MSAPTRHGHPFLDYSRTMARHARRALFLAAVTSLLFSVCVRAGPLYDELMTEFSRHEHRLPGSPEFESSITKLESALRAAGLAPRRQTFNTLVPVAREIRFTVGGREIGPLHALAPNGVALVTTGGRVLAGPVVYAGSGDLASIKHLPIPGAIVILDLGSRHMLDVFSLGAKAVILVGIDSAAPHAAAASQWDLWRQFTEVPIHLPRYFIDRADAAPLGLAARDTPRVLAAEGSLASTAAWEDRVATNLWVELAGEPGATFALGREETLVLHATLDTFGIVPTRSPQLRDAANCALLAEVVVELARQPRRRSIVAFFGGSYYQLQEAVRYFYYAVNKAERGPRNFDPLDEREASLRAQLATIAARLDLLAQPDFLRRDHPEAFHVLQIFRRDIENRVNDLNFSLYHLQRRAAGSDFAATASERATLTAEKNALNRLRPQLNRREISSDSQPTFLQLVGAYTSALEREGADAARMLGHLATHRELAARFAGRAIVAHLGFHFASAQAPWFFNAVGADDDVIRERAFVGLFLKQLQTLGQIYATVERPEWQPARLYAPALTGAFEPEYLSTPRWRFLASAPASAAGVTAFQLTTVGDALAHDDLPLRAAPDLAPLRPQLAEFIAALGRVPELSIRPATTVQLIDPRATGIQRGNRIDGYRLTRLATGTTNIEGPLAHGIVAIGGQSERFGKIAGISRLALSRSTAEGALFVPGLRKHHSTNPANLNGHLFDATGRLTAVGYERFQLQEQTFSVWGNGFFVPFRPDNYDRSLKPLVLHGRNNASFAQERVWQAGDNHLAIYASEDRPVKISVGGLLLLNADEREPFGRGLPLGDGTLHSLDTVHRAAEDYFALNRARLQALRSRNFFDPGLERLHATAEEHVTRARVARREPDLERARAHEVMATAVGERAYGPIKDVVGDMVVAVVLLLILAVPFAFCLERLLCGFATIYRQLAGFGGFFLLTFAALYFTHPAFALANAPIVILLAFVILLLATTVMWLVLSRFRHEVMALQGLASRTHDASHGGGGLLVSVVIGIGGMRNRPLKTALTASTIVLLTFTILVFSSFGGQLGVNSTLIGGGDKIERIEVHRSDLLQLLDPHVDALRTLYRDRYDVAVRSAVIDDPNRSQERPENLLYNLRTQRTARLQTALGLERAEVAARPDLRALLDGDALARRVEGRPALFLPAQIVAALEARVGDPLTLRGLPFHFAGEFNAAALSRIVNLGETRLVPPNYALSLPPQSKDTKDYEVEQALASLDATTFVFSETSQLAVGETSAIAPLGRPQGAYHAVTLFPKSAFDLRRDAAAIALSFQGPVFAQTSEGAYRFIYSKALRASGLGDVLLPLALGGLIIFSSLLGSIVDREREIATYSALGLAPIDVGALFFAESGVFAVIGGMGGYLLGQAVSKLMLAGSRVWGFEPLAINFSSLSSIYTILLVMGVVFVSTIYPARKAGKLASPGVARKWKMPKPQGNRMRFVFPFTVSSRDIGGILAFLREHFDHHRDASLGNFAARDVRVSATPEGTASLEADVSLAPFDLGVFQKFRLTSQPSDIAGIDEVVVELQRLSGPPTSWRRSNKRFIAELREQFLVWRSLPVETMEHYRAHSENEIPATPASAP